MKIKVDTSGLRESRWYQYLIRFIFGAAVTALAGVIAERFGPRIGGLFLAFPAILPATATLVEKHETEKKAREGKNGARGGRAAAGVDAAGAAMGSIGLVVFALIVWKKLPHGATGPVLLAATVAWCAVSISIWKLRETLWRKILARFHAVSSRRSPKSSHRDPLRQDIHSRYSHHSSSHQISSQLRSAHPSSPVKRRFDE